MTYEPVATADKALPYSAYRLGNYVGNMVKVVVLIGGSDDGSIPALADRFTTADGVADFPAMFSHPYTDTDDWDFGCDGKEWTSSMAAVGFLEAWDGKHMDAFAKANPGLRITVSYETAEYNGVWAWRRGKRTESRHTPNRWATAGNGWKETTYAEFQAREGDRVW